MIRVHWLLPGSYSGSKDLIESSLASTRMRAGLVARHARELPISLSFGDFVKTEADVVVVGKIGRDCRQGRSASWLDQLGEAKRRNRKIILDYTDHHLAIVDSPMREFYEKAFVLSDVVVSPSDHMQALVAELFEGKCLVIEDALEVSIYPPKRDLVGNLPNVLWFGHGSNIAYLIEYLEDGRRCDSDFGLEVLTNREGYEFFAFQRPKIRRGTTVVFKQWSLENMVAAAKACNACIIPSDPSDMRKAGVSSNRLLTSLALGFPTSASLMPSYQSSSAYFHDIGSTSLSTFLAHLDVYRQKTVEAQAVVLPQYEPRSIAREWRDVFIECCRGV